jgi:hypothetical protein
MLKFLATGEVFRPRRDLLLLFQKAVKIFSLPPQPWHWFESRDPETIAQRVYHRFYQRFEHFYILRLEISFLLFFGNS